ncbi:MAG: LptF/LptG family permease [bacterium]
MKLLTRHIWSELVPSCGEGAVLLTFIFLLKRMLDILTRLMDTGAQPTNVLGLFMTMIPPVSILTLPMAILLGTLLTYGRLAEENEITAMEAGGLTLARIYRPAIIFGTIVTIFLLFWSHFVVPKSLRLFQQSVVGILQKTATGGITPGRFMRLGELTLVCERMDSDTKRLYGTTIFENTRNKGVAAVVTAPTADFQLFPERGELVLDLHDVFLHRTRPAKVEGEQSDQTILSERMHWTTDVHGLVQRVARDALKVSQYSPAVLNRRIADEREVKEQQLARRDELREIIKKKSSAPEAERMLKVIEAGLLDGERRTARLELERAFRISLPFAALLMAAVAAPFGVLMRRGRRGVAFAVTIVLVLIYYILMSLGKALAADGALPAWFGLWLPNFAAILIAAAAYRKTIYP